jgi:transcriptional regulator with XRE-family HTH domain
VSVSGNPLARAREAAGFSQETFADAVGVSRNTVSRWERGVCLPAAGLRLKIANALGITPGELHDLLDRARGWSHAKTGAGQPVVDEDRQQLVEVSRHAADEPVPASLSSSGEVRAYTRSPGHDERVDLVFPAIANDAVGDDDVMSPLDRRSLIRYGIAAAAVPPTTGAPRAHTGLALPTIEVDAGASWAAATYNTVLNPTEAARRAAADETDFLAGSALRSAADQAIQLELTSDFGALERLLPAAIGQVEASAIRSAGDLRATQQALSDVYAVVGWTLIKADLPLGAWLAAQRAVDAAERADDVLRIAAATRCLAEVHMRAGNLAEATRTAFLATVHLDRTSPGERPRALSIRGAALLSAAAASARRGDAREARAALQAAAVCADQLGHDRADLGTVFGPTNVAIHRVAVAIELGEPREAVRHVPDVQLGRMPEALTERRSRFLIDVARSYAGVRDDRAAIDALIEAERIAPDELRHHRLTREVVVQLIRRERRSSDLRTLAERCGLPV